MTDIGMPISYRRVLERCVSPIPATDLPFRERTWLLRNGYIQKFPLHNIKQRAEQSRPCCIVTDKGKQALEVYANANP